MSPLRFLIVGGFLVCSLCWAAGFAIHGLPGEDWMNWKGWGWIFAPINMAIGVWFGWDVRGTHERSLALAHDDHGQQDAGQKQPGEVLEDPKKKAAQ